MTHREWTVPGLVRMSERALAALVIGLSLLVVLAVVALITFPGVLRVQGLDVTRLPAFHATLNGATAILLATGVVLVRSGRVAGHRVAMLSAFILSCIFLFSYVVYHSQSPGARFGGEGWIRPAYFLVLITHVVLAPVVLPLALYSVARALRGELVKHRALARWTFPIWLYVAVTGVLVYLLMAPYY